MIITCESCGFENSFKQEHPYHAGRSDLGFLYNDEGNLTLVWSTFDPDYQRIVGRVHPWVLSQEQQAKLESNLMPAPSGGNWSFKNVPRCSNCHQPIGRSAREGVYFLIFPDSLELGNFEKGKGLKTVMKRIRLL